MFLPKPNLLGQLCSSREIALFSTHNVFQVQSYFPLNPFQGIRPHWRLKKLNFWEIFPWKLEKLLGYNLFYFIYWMFNYIFIFFNDINLFICDGTRFSIRCANFFKKYLADFLSCTSRAVVRLGQLGRRLGCGESPGRKNFCLWKENSIYSTNKNGRFIKAFRKYKNLFYVTYIDCVLFLFRFRFLSFFRS